MLRSETPWCTHHGLGSFPFARRYLGNRCFFLFLRLLRCFSSPGSLPYVMYWRMDDWSSDVCSSDLPRSFHQGSTCLDVLWIPPCHLSLRVRGCYPLWRDFPILFCSGLRDKCRSTTPRSKLLGLGSFHFARRYFGNRCFFLFLRLLRCFSSPGSLLYAMDLRIGD